jgi:hypothetical protein
MKALPVRRLSAILSIVSAKLRDEFGLTKLAIGGGSAPALLDHLFSGNALRMRDFDLVLVADRNVEQPLARFIGEALDSPELRFLPRYVYPRKRSRGDNDLWNAGWGLLCDANGVEVDLSIFHDANALDLNGLMTVDRIRIPLPAEMSLNEIAAKMLVAGSADAAVDAGLVEDPCGGYAGWVHRAPVIVAWHAIHASPVECAIRIVRACANKLHLSHLHSELADPLRAAVLQGHDRGDHFLRVRTIVKLFHDDRAGVELEMIHALGVFEHWLPEIGQLINRVGHGGLTAIFAQADRELRKDPAHRAAFAEAGEQGGDEVSARRLEALLLNMSQGKRELILGEVAIAEPTFAAVVRKQLPYVERRTAKGAPRPKRRTTPSRQLPSPHPLVAVNAPVDLVT